MSGLASPGRIVLVKCADSTFVAIVRRGQTRSGQQICVTLFTDDPDQPTRVLDLVPALVDDVTGAYGWYWPPRV